jgi:putative membrane protein
MPLDAATRKAPAPQPGRADDQLLLQRLAPSVFTDPRGPHHAGARLAPDSLALHEESSMYWGYYHYWGMHLFWWIFWFGLVMMLLFTGWPRSRMTTDDRAIEALRARYAAGDIDELEYRERLAVLQGQASKNPRDRNINPAA